MTSEPAQFGALLRQWRHLRETTQATLAKRTGISIRHLSFLENGRAQPSRDMVEWLAEALELPARERGTWLAAAGFAMGEQAQVAATDVLRAAAEDLVATLSETPVLAHDVTGTILAVNGACRALLGQLVGDLSAYLGERGGHQLVAAVRGRIGNWDAVVEMYIRRLLDEMLLGAGRRLQDTFDEWRDTVDPELLARALDRREAPRLTVDVTVDLEQPVRLRVFTATIGTHRLTDGGVVRLLCFAPTDELSRQLLDALDR